MHFLLIPTSPTSGTSHIANNMTTTLALLAPQLCLSLLPHLKFPRCYAGKDIMRMSLEGQARFRTRTKLKSLLYSPGKISPAICQAVSSRAGTRLHLRLSLLLPKQPSPRSIVLQPKSPLHLVELFHLLEVCLLRSLLRMLGILSLASRSMHPDLFAQHLQLYLNH
jgi:hypothetical protein